jgi:phospholipid transport system substrate-binding protein
MTIRLKRFSVALAVLFALVLVRPAPCWAGTDGAVKVVERLHGALLGAMQQGATLGFQGRLHQIAPVIEASFDFSAIARIITGSHWGKLDNAQQALFVETFSNLSKSTYASQFDVFAGERFETLGSEPAENGRVVVRSQIVQSDGDIVNLNYVVQGAGEHWRIVNVIADGVSDLSLKRADYTSVLDSNGFEPLIGKLNEKITHYASTGR